MSIKQKDKNKQLFESTPEREQVANQIKQLAERVELDWDDPIAFDVIETPEIPSSLLPTWLGDYAKYVAMQTQTPEGISVLLALSTIATCVQKRFVVAPSENYSEPLNLWTLSAAPPGSRKSAVFNLMTGALRDWEQRKEKSLARKIAENKTQRTVITKRIEKLERDAASKDDADEREKIIKEVARLKMDMPEPVNAPCLWTGDVTTERLQNLLVDCGEKISVLSDEAGIFSVMAGMYSDNQINIDVFLQGHAGSPVRVERSTRSAYLKRPALTFGLTVQPDILSEFSKGNKRRFRGNGALARFLYCIPKSNIGKRDVRSDFSIPPETSLNFVAGVNSLLDLPDIVDAEGHAIPEKLSLSQDAKDLWHQFLEDIEFDHGEGKSLESIQDWTAKLPGAALRIAGICHVVEHGRTTLEISGNSMDRAIDICNLLIPHALVAFDLITANTNVSNAKYILSTVRSSQKRTVNRTELKNLGRFRSADKSVLDDAVLVLQERNYLSEEQLVPSATKPTRTYLVNPKAFLPQKK